MSLFNHFFAVRFQSLRLFRIARLGIVLTFLLFSDALLSQGSAITVTINGDNYDLEILTIAYEDDSEVFAKPSSGGRMPWWDDQSLSEEFSIQLGAGLSPTPLPLYGPLFAYSISSGSVISSVLELATSGTTDFVDSSYTVSPTSVQTYAAVVVPAPLPLLGIFAACHSSRNIRKRIRKAKLQ